MAELKKKITSEKSIFGTERREIEVEKMGGQSRQQADD